MSQLEELRIRGIRGFSPDEEDTQVITFNAPLTVISGINGSGKTVIIYGYFMPSCLFPEILC